MGKNGLPGFSKACLLLHDPWGVLKTGVLATGYRASYPLGPVFLVPRRAVAGPLWLSAQGPGVADPEAEAEQPGEGWDD